MSTLNFDSQVFQTFNPTTNSVLTEYKYDSFSTIEKKIFELKSSWQTWRLATLSQRSDFFKALALELQNESEFLARMMALEMGKPLTDGRAEVEKCVSTALYYAENLEKILFSEKIKIPGFEASIEKNSLGVVFAIMPWNYPLWQLIRFAVPAIAVGNVVLMKHSDLTAGVAELLESLFHRANSSQKLLLNSRMKHETAALCIAHPDIQAVTFTGSTKGGREVAKLAGCALKKTVMELGGSDPYIVFNDTDIASTAQICARARMINNGQSCIAAKRFFIQSEIYDEFLHKFSESMTQYQYGDPQDLGVSVGPLASVKSKNELEKKIAQISEAKITLLKNNFDFEKNKAAFFQPRILEFGDAKSYLKLWDEEYFGPVSSLWKFETEDEVLKIANHTSFGLGSSVFSRDSGKCSRIASQLESGMVFINEMVRSDAHLPFGGIKQSGYGRELGTYGPLEFMNIKSIVTKI